MDAAAALASIFPGARRVFTFSDDLVEVPPRVGMAGVDAITRSQLHNGTQLFLALARLNETVKYDRIIIITDEQAHGGSRMPAPNCQHGYVINVASYQNGIGYGRWTHLDGFSERVIQFIHERETSEFQ